MSNKRINELTLKEDSLAGYFFAVDIGTDAETKKLSADKVLTSFNPITQQYLRTLDTGVNINTVAAGHANYVYAPAKGIYKWLADEPAEGLFAEVVAAPDDGYWCLVFPVAANKAMQELVVNEGVILMSIADGPNAEVSGIAASETNITLTLNQLNDGDSFFIVFKRDVTGGAVSVNLPENTVIIGTGVTAAIALSAGANKVDLLEGKKVGTNIYVRFTADT